MADGTAKLGKGQGALEQYQVQCEGATISWIYHGVDNDGMTVLDFMSKLRR